PGNLRPHPSRAPTRGNGTSQERRTTARGSARRNDPIPAGCRSRGPPLERSSGLFPCTFSVNPGSAILPDTRGSTDPDETTASGTGRVGKSGRGDPVDSRRASRDPCQDHESGRSGTSAPREQVRSGPRSDTRGREILIGDVLEPEDPEVDPVKKPVEILRGGLRVRLKPAVLGRGNRGDPAPLHLIRPWIVDRDRVGR